MRTILKTSLLVLTLIVLNSCNGGAKEIDYGNDGCHFCKMTIVDKIHGAQLVTDKGKVFKFDATECMVNYMADTADLALGSTLTNYYESPTAFITTNEATFLISENIPSPMGAYLTAFQDQATAERIQMEKGGELYNWEALKSHLNN